MTFTYLDAECRLDPSTWDGESYDQIVEARDGCLRCPALTACAAWAKGRRDLVGIVAGKPRDPATADRARRGKREARALDWTPVYPVRPINHGKQGGYQAHIKRGEEPCDDCKAAKSAAEKRYRAARKAKAKT